MLGATRGELHLLGWKAMPFARDDFDSNCQRISKDWISRQEIHWKGGVRTLVNIPEEDCILKAGGMDVKPELRSPREENKAGKPYN